MRISNMTNKCSKVTFSNAHIGLWCMMFLILWSYYFQHSNAISYEDCLHGKRVLYLGNSVMRMIAYATPFFEETYNETSHEV